MADAISPLFLATAVQAVIKAGAMQLAGIDKLDIEKKGTIDLVTQVDKDVERMFRALIGERFPDHAVLAEEFELSGDRQNEAEYCWVFDPVDGIEDGRLHDGGDARDVERRGVRRERGLKQDLVPVRDFVGPHRCG